MPTAIRASPLGPALTMKGNMTQKEIEKKLIVSIDKQAHTGLTSRILNDTV